jgi:hypothetical protein
MINEVERMQELAGIETDNVGKSLESIPSEDYDAIWHWVIQLVYRMMIIPTQLGNDSLFPDTYAPTDCPGGPLCP